MQMIGLRNEWDGHFYLHDAIILTISSLLVLLTI